MTSRAAAPVIGAIRFPAELPVVVHREEIAATIRDNQVTIVAGETGSGKTTQLPKICLELGRGVDGMIGHTQPRRIAATSVAARIASELDVELGVGVGYQIRFGAEMSADTRIKVMTDGILLAEVAADPLLRRYDTLIIDEAHERSLNIDFLLGYLKRLLPKRPDLKLVITSATIDPERFARYFSDAPIISVSGRTYPVEVRYRPLDADDPDYLKGITSAVTELLAAADGDILVFLSGEREIRDAADAVTGMKVPGVEVLPLYARLSSAEQQRVFAPHPGRRVVLATNVAETSLTVPGIRSVIDVGTARISRYSARLKIQQLPIEPVSQASARQRAGRCGRLGPGICIRLYSEDDFMQRPEYTEPEILRTSLAAVILRMAALGLGAISGFPFLDPPDRRQITAGIRLLHELGALVDTGDSPLLTDVGRQLAALPVDPRFARMVVAAAELGCLREMVIIAAALSVIDPRERPSDAREQADAAHARFTEPQSDYVTFLNVWRYVREQQRTLSSSQFRKLCRREYLNFVRIREWQDIASQLRHTLGTLGMRANNSDADSDTIHQAIVAGLLSHIGMWDSERKQYLGARGARFAIAPGSALFRKQSRWVMVAELVETNRLWGRIAAAITPEWAERYATHLVVRSYSEPRWSRRAGAIVATEKVTLFGLPIVTSRTINYGRIDQEVARDLFIRRALVEGGWRAHHDFLHHNDDVIAEARELENRLRRGGLVDDDVIAEFYAARLPADVVSVRHFERWWKQARRENPQQLDLSVEYLVSHADSHALGAYPDSWQVGEWLLPVSYEFHPGGANDGVTVTVPSPALPQVSAATFSWQVPGLREELITALLKSLPKEIRRRVSPLAATANRLAAELEPADTDITVALSRALRAQGIAASPGDFKTNRLDDYLRVTFRVVDAESDDVLATGKDLGALQVSLARHTQQRLTAVREDVERSGITRWDFGDLPQSIRSKVGTIATTSYPALVDDGDSVSIRVLESEPAQVAALRQGVRRLLILHVGTAPRRILQARPRADMLALSQLPGGIAASVDDAVAGLADQVVLGNPLPFTESEFENLAAAIRVALAERLDGVLTSLVKLAGAVGEVEAELAQLTQPMLAAATEDVAAQLGELVHPGFIVGAGVDRLSDIVRYVRGAAYRLQRLAGQPARDTQPRETIAGLHDEIAVLADTHPTEAEDLWWAVEELRINLFAQPIGSPYKVSEVRIRRAIAELRAKG